MGDFRYPDPGSEEPQSLDALLQLMDRQVTDVDGRMVCKVDDVELSHLPDGRLAATALLTGQPVWLPRISRWLSERWRWMSFSKRDHEDPFRLGLDVVEEITSEIRLNLPREGILVRNSDGRLEGRHRLSDLLNAAVHDRDGRTLGRVLDVRLEPAPGEPVRRPVDHLVVAWLLVGRAVPGMLLGYDRRQTKGPWVLSRLLGALTRHAGMVRIDHVEDIDWDAGELTVSGELEPLTQGNAPGRPLRDR